MFARTYFARKPDRKIFNSRDAKIQRNPPKIAKAIRSLINTTELIPNDKNR